MDSLIAYEKPFTEHGTIAAAAGSNWFIFMNGEKNILVMAPHATAQTREGKIKIPDGGTGSLAIALHTLCNVPVLYTSYLSPSDPNYYDDNAFKDTLAKIIRLMHPLLVVDLHGSQESRPYDVDFGTLDGASLGNKPYLLDSLILQLQDCGIISLSSNFFSAATHQTDTKFVHSMGIPCLQLEINSNYLIHEQGGICRQKSAQLLQALVRFIKCVQ